MPDEKGALSKEEMNRVADALQKSWGDKPAGCQMCGNTDWELNRIVVAPMALGSDASFRLSAATYGLISIRCKTCSQMVFFNARRFGLFDKEQEGQVEKTAATAKPEEVSNG